MSVGRLAALLVVAGLLAGGGYVTSRLVSFSSTVLPPAGAGALPTEWYSPDGLVRRDDSPPLPGVASTARAWIVLLNLSRLPSLAEATFYFEDLPPRSTTLLLPGLGRRRLSPDDHPDLVPPNTRYGVRVRSTSPIIVQPTRGEYTPHDSVTEAMASYVAHPGPLGVRETRWAYADGLLLESGEPLEEREWVTILNPNPQHDAAIELAFLMNDRRETTSLVVPAERVRSVDLATVPVVPKNVGFGVVVTSDVPVVVEEVRRAYRKGNPNTASLFSCLAHPIGGSADDDLKTP